MGRTSGSSWGGTVPGPHLPIVDFYARRSWDDLRVEHFRLPQGRVIEHDHPHVQVAIPFSPASVVACWRTGTGRPQRRRMGDGESLVVASGQPHTVQWERGGHFVMFHLSPAFLGRIARDGIANGPSDIAEGSVLRDPLVHDIGLALRANARGDAIPERLYVEALATLLALHLPRTVQSVGWMPPAVGALEPRRLQRVRDFVDAHLDDDLALAALADAAGLSPYHFARSFKAATGLTPHQHVRAQRLERAQALLRETELPIVDVCSRAGFANQSHCTAVFRALAATTPKAYRATLRSR